MGLLTRLDVYGTDDPDFQEGHPEDRCPLCSDAVDRHPCWPHRRAAATELVAQWFDRVIIRRSR